MAVKPCYENKLDFPRFLIFSSIFKHAFSRVILLLPYFYLHVVRKTACIRDNLTVDYFRPKGSKIATACGFLLELSWTNVGHFIEVRNMLFGVFEWVPMWKSWKSVHMVKSNAILRNIASFWDFISGKIIVLFVWGFFLSVPDFLQFLCYFTFLVFAKSTCILFHLLHSQSPVSRGENQH